jgi:nitroreductase
MRDLLEVMWQRHTCRAAFDPHREVREADLQRLLDAARWAPTAHNAQNYEIIVVDDKHCLDAIIAIPLPPIETFAGEKYRALSVSQAESLRGKTGLLASMLPQSWHEAAAPEHNSDAPHAIYVGRTIRPCPMLLVVVHDVRLSAHATEGDALGLMSLGCVMQNLWLMSESLGISMQILTAFSTAAVENQVQPILGIPPHMKIAFAARVGYPVAHPESYVRVRRKIREFTHRNRYSVADPVQEG